MARPIIRAATGITLSKRILLSEFTIPDATSADYDTAVDIDLVECTEAMDEEVESNGTTIADVPLYSRLTAMRTQFLVRAGTATIVRWALYKKPDGEQLVTSLADSNFHSSNDVQNNREFRKNTVAKGLLFVSPDRLASNFRIFVKRKAWARISPMRENDKLCLVMAKDMDGTTATLDGFGTIWCRANG